MKLAEIWIIVIFVSELSAWLVLGLSNVDVKTEGAKVIVTFTFIPVALMWVKQKNVNVPMFNMWIITV